mgnify:CR=1 FL=1
MVDAYLGRRGRRARALKGRASGDYDANCHAVPASPACRSSVFFVSHWLGTASLERLALESLSRAASTRSSSAAVNVLLGRRATC